jgi:hypothetical protein
MKVRKRDLVYYILSGLITLLAIVTMTIVIAFGLTWQF